MLLSYFAVGAYLISAMLLGRYFTKNSSTHPHQKTVSLLISFAIVVQALNFSDFYTTGGIVFGLANSASFIAWLIAALLFLSSFSQPVHALGILVYPLAAITLIFAGVFPDIDGKVVSLSVASHVILSIAAYALLAIALCQSILLRIQENHLHAKKINSFINKLPPLQTMECLLFQSVRVGFYFLTLSLVSGMIFIDDLFAQHLVHKTALSIVAWVIFATLVFGRSIFGWRGKQAITAIQVGFVILVIAYFGSKFVLERLL